MSRVIKQFHDPKSAESLATVIRILIDNAEGVEGGINTVDRRTNCISGFEYSGGIDAVVVVIETTSMNLDAKPALEIVQEAFAKFSQANHDDEDEGDDDEGEGDDDEGEGDDDEGEDDGGFRFNVN